MNLHFVLAQFGGGSSVFAPFLSWIIQQLQGVVRPVGIIVAVGLGLWMLIDRHHVMPRVVGAVIAIAVAAMGPQIATTLLNTLGAQ